MLKGKELGAAIKQAIDLKIASGAIVSKADVAKYFDIKTPSIYDWIKKGSISKDKLVKLWDYFSDVVGPEHWGIDNSVYKAAKVGSSPSTLKQDQTPYRDSFPLNQEEKQMVLSYRKRGRDLQLAVLRSLDVQPTDFAKSA
jgi:carbonic anhydrase